MDNFLDYKKEYEKWCSYSFLDDDLKNELHNIKNDTEEVKDRFSLYVQFGTGGMRGTMGAGTNRLNVFTIVRATIGLAKYVKSHNAEKKGVAITCDTRNNSKKFAKISAAVLNYYGIITYISKDVRPTPFLSYAVRTYKTFAGINITASHNRKEDNGYKVYMYDGAQFSPPDDSELVNFVNGVNDSEIIDFFNNRSDKENALFRYIDKKVENEFLNNACSYLINKSFCQKNGKKLKVIYTPLHGTGSVFLLDAFKKTGFTNVQVVKIQDDKCGDFKSVSYPNPETKEAYKVALEMAIKKDADLIVATDPDCDRLGVYTKISKGKYFPLTGNELASCILEYMLYFYNKKGMDLKKGYVARSFVTTTMIDKICSKYNIETKITPTGFKWIGKEILKEKNKKFLFACEESYGYLINDYVRDKDAVSGVLITLEIALCLKNAGYNFKDLLYLLYDAYGVHKNYVTSFEFKGITGKETMANMMSDLRTNYIKNITDVKVNEFIDCLNLKRVNMSTESISNYDFYKNDSLIYVLSDESRITIRPSGTEPKIKIYYDIVDKSIELADNKFEILSQGFNKILNKEH